MVNLDRLHGINMAQLYGMDIRSDIELSQFIEDNFRDRRLFLSQLHPTGFLCAEIARQVIAQLGIVPADDPQLRETLEEVEATHGIGDIDAPIHPGIVEHFGLDWARGLQYRYFDEGFYDHDTFVRRYIRFTNVPEYFPARAMMNRSNWAEAERLLRLSIAKSPGSARFHACLGRVLCQQDRWPEAGEAFSTAIALDGGRDGYHGDLARVQLRSDPTTALHSIDAALAMKPADPELCETRLEICRALGNADAIARAEADLEQARDGQRWPPFLEPTGAIYGRYWLPKDGSGF